MSGCMDLRKRWNNLVGKSEEEAVETIKQDGKKSLDRKNKNNNHRILILFIKLGEQNIEVVDDGTPEANAAIKSGVVRVILDQNKNVKYPPLRQN
jgi:hypothetical protein